MASSVSGSIEVLSWRQRELNEMNRREFITIFGTAALALPSRGNAQVSAKIPKVGMLWHAGSAEEEGAYFASLTEGFRDLGYVEGRTILTESEGRSR
jgi:putative ABC transport system substrate-binding protein